MPRDQRILPFIRDLNPLIDDLARIVQIIAKHGGDRPKIVDGVFRLFKRAKKRRGFTKHSIDANTVSSLAEANLGIMTSEGRLTVLGADLDKLVTKPDEFKKRVVRHLLLNRAGWQFCRGLAVLGSSGRKPTRQELADFLAHRYRIEEWRDHNNLSSLHSFLQWGSIAKNYVLNVDRFSEMMSVSPSEIGAFEGLKPQAGDLFKSLIRLGGKATVGEIRTGAESVRSQMIDVHKVTTYGAELVGAGLIEVDTKRGRRNTIWKVKDDRKAAALSALSATLTLHQVVPDDVFQRSFKDILDDLTKATRRKVDKQTRGRLLETFAAKICWLLGLENIVVRLRSEYEVDVRAESLTPIYAPWLIQCKATTGNVGSSVLLREYAIAELEGAHIIMVVTTADFSGDCRSLADRIQRRGRQIVLLDGESLRRIASDESELYEAIREQSRRTSRIKRGFNPQEVFQELDNVAHRILADEIELADVWHLLDQAGIGIPLVELELLLKSWRARQSRVATIQPRKKARRGRGSKGKSKRRSGESNRPRTI